jgi:cytochrome c oxidase assembly protein subunit 15
VLLGVQILLGALTVWLRLAPWTVTAHLVTGNAFAVSLLLAAVALRNAAVPRATVLPASRLQRLVLAGAAVLLALQILLGGLVSSRYAGLACPEWPTCNGGVWFPSVQGAVGLHLFHRWNGTALLAALVAAAVACRHHARLRTPAAWACGLGVAQVIVGVLNVRLGIPVEVTGLHSALAAGLVLVLAIALREAARRDVPR